MRRTVVLVTAAVALLAVLLAGGCKQKPPEKAAEAPAAGPGKPALADYYTGFKRAEKGDWAEWNVNTGDKMTTVKYVFVGEEVINGKQAYGLEFSGELNGKQAAQQIWISRETGEPVRFVAKLPEGVFCLDVSLYRQPPETGSPQPQTPKEYEPKEIEPLQWAPDTYTTESGKTIKVIKVSRPDKKEEMWLSSRVPFGFVKVIAEGKTMLELKDFGSGDQPVINREEMLNCRQFNLPTLPQSLPTIPRR